MLQLVNLSNYDSDIELIRNSPECLAAFLDRFQLDGLEMMFCGPQDVRLHKSEWIHGVHLRFWPAWLDFWRGDRTELLRQFGSEANIEAYYGTQEREPWLNIFRENIRYAKLAGANYLVLHVSHARNPELFSWQFSAGSREVVLATIEVVNELAADIPEEMELLFENLWWPGMTLQDRQMVSLLLENVRHKNSGIMLDTGHLMNTNPNLRSEEAGIDFILDTVKRLEDYGGRIRGVHLHRSLSGEYSLSSRWHTKEQYTFTDVMSHVMKLDQHLPFQTAAVRRIVEFVRPEYLVHEFIAESMADWEQKLACQQMALGMGSGKDA